MLRAANAALKTGRPLGQRLQAGPWLLMALLCAQVCPAPAQTGSSSPAADLSPPLANLRSSLTDLSPPVANLSPPLADLSPPVANLSSPRLLPTQATLALPDAPGTSDSQASPPAPAPPAAPPADASLRGTVVDQDGALVAGARITVTGGGLSQPQVAVSDSDGHFTFAALPPGRYDVAITTSGLAEAHTWALLRAAQTLDLASIPLSVEEAHVDIDVVLNHHDQVELQVKQEETQRILGLLPNFYVSYDWHAAPLSTGQKYELAWRTMIDPVSFVFTGATAGVQQATNSFSGYGQGAQGYGKRYGAAYADFAIGTVLGGAVLPSLLHQDPRYFIKGTGGFKARLWYSFTSAYVCRSDKGRLQPNYSSVIGDLAAGAASNLYYPKSDQSAWDLVLENGLLGTVFDGLGDVVQEFIFSRITTSAKHTSASRP